MRQTHNNNHNNNNSNNNNNNQDIDMCIMTYTCVVMYIYIFIDMGSILFPQMGTHKLLDVQSPSVYPNVSRTPHDI